MKKMLIIVAAIGFAFAACGKKTPPPAAPMGDDMGSAAPAGDGSAAGSDAAPAGDGSAAPAPAP